jgi:hypothetical protein
MSTAEAVLNALHGYDIKEKGQGNYRLNSPLRSGANSHSFALKIEGDENGTWFDHVTNEGGSLYDLADKLGIKRDRYSVASTKRAYADRDEYAQAHGLPDAALEAAGWHYTTYTNRPALTFSTKGGRRWRFLDDQSPHYISERGYKRCWYGLARAKDQSLKAGCFIVCNGEISTIAAQFISLPAASVTGGEKGEIPAELMAELQATIPTTTRIVVAMDCDKTGRAASAKMVAQLIKAGYQAHAVDLNLSEGGDLADYCMLYKDQSLPSLLSLPPMTAPALATKQPRGKVYSLADLAKLPRPEWLVENELPRFGIGFLFGRSGIGKSFFAAMLAHHISMQHPVLYVALEGRYGYRSRIDALNTAKFTRDEDLKLNFWLDPLDLSSDDSVNHFITAAINTVKPVLVIIDTLSQAMGIADPNTPRDMLKVVKSMQMIQESANGLVLAVHHARKADNTYAGASVLYNACDIVMEVRELDGQIEVSNPKQKDGESFDTRYMKLVPIQLPSGDMVPVAMPADRITQGQGDKLTPYQRKVLDCLADTFGDGAPFGDLLDATEIAKTSLFRVMRVLTLLGFVNQQSGPRGLYRITKLGEEKIGKTALTLPAANDVVPNEVPSSNVVPNDVGTTNTQTTTDETVRSSKFQSIFPQNDDATYNNSVGTSGTNGTWNHDQETGYRIKPISGGHQSIVCADCGASNWTVSPRGGWLCMTCGSNTNEVPTGFGTSMELRNSGVRLAFDTAANLDTMTCQHCNHKLVENFTHQWYCQNCREEKQNALETQSPDEAVFQ